MITELDSGMLKVIAFEGLADNMDNMDNMLDVEKPRIALSQSTVEFFSRLVLR